MISIDTDLMRQLVAAANAANNNITTAMNLLTSITSHQDWACKEKDAINNYSTTNKNKIRNLHQDSQAFLSAITAVAGEYETAENSISDMFSTVESLLASIMSVAGGAIGSVVGGVASAIGSATPILGPNVLGGVASAISSATPILATNIKEQFADAVSFIVEPISTGPVNMTEIGIQNGMLDNIINNNFIHSKMEGFNPFEHLESVFEQYEFINVAKPISICEFSDLIFK